MPFSTVRYSLRALGRGARLRCPECGQGDIFERGLHMHEVCAYCGVRFERAPGEALGAAYLLGALTLVTTLTGVLLIDVVLDADPTPFIAVWIAITLLINLVLYRRLRGLWIGVLYLTGGVYADQDYEREYIAPDCRSQYSEEKR